MPNTLYNNKNLMDAIIIIAIFAIIIIAIFASEIYN